MLLWLVVTPSTPLKHSNAIQNAGFCLGPKEEPFHSVEFFVALEDGELAGGDGGQGHPVKDVPKTGPSCSWRASAAVLMLNLVILAPLVDWCGVHVHPDLPWRLLVGGDQVEGGVDGFPWVHILDDALLPH